MINKKRKPTPVKVTAKVTEETQPEATQPEPAQEEKVTQPVAYFFVFDEYHFAFIPKIITTRKDLSSFAATISSRSPLEEDATVVKANEVELPPATYNCVG
jgi:hypothetical protein